MNKRTKDLFAQETYRAAIDILRHNIRQIVAPYYGEPTAEDAATIETIFRWALAPDRGERSCINMPRRSGRRALMASIREFRRLYPDLSVKSEDDQSA